MKAIVRCKNCKFWEPSSREGAGECRRKAPVPFPDAMLERGGSRKIWWPLTIYEDGCGEGEER